MYVEIIHKLLSSRLSPMVNHGINFLKQSTSVYALHITRHLMLKLVRVV